MATCKLNHVWVVTAARPRVVSRWDDSSLRTDVHRICKNCLLKETHEVEGVVVMDKAKDIFEGVREV